jgi:hypothetical protein
MWLYLVSLESIGFFFLNFSAFFLGIVLSTSYSIFFMYHVRPASNLIQHLSIVLTKGDESEPVQLAHAWNPSYSGGEKGGWRLKASTGKQKDHLNKKVWVMEHTYHFS